MKRFQLIEGILKQYWRQFTLDYIPTLHKTEKWFRKEAPFKVHDIVCVLQPGLPCGRWPLGRITEVYTSKDGQVRVVMVETHVNGKKQVNEEECVRTNASYDSTKNVRRKKAVWMGPNDEEEVKGCVMRTSNITNQNSRLKTVCRLTSKSGGVASNRHFEEVQKRSDRKDETKKKKYLPQWSSLSSQIFEGGCFHQSVDVTVRIQETVGTDHDEFIDRLERPPPTTLFGASTDHEVARAFNDLWPHLNAGGTLVLGAYKNFDGHDFGKITVGGLRSKAVAINLNRLRSERFRSKKQLAEETLDQIFGWINDPNLNILIQDAESWAEFMVSCGRMMPERYGVFHSSALVEQAMKPWLDWSTVPNST